MSKCKNDLNGTVHWIILFFFRLYVSCRSLYHQAVSLMHPDSSKKMSMLGDFSAGYSGWDWIARADLTDEGYFSWILRPSASLHNVIQSVLHNVVQEGSADYSSLIYVMHVMCFQRLVDLNRKIQSTEYLIQKNDNLIKSKLMDDCGSFLMHNNRNKWQRFLSVLRQEATSLTDFIMGYLSLVDEKRLSISIVIDEISNESSIQMYKTIDSWDLGVCAVNEKTLPTAVWWIICRNIDIWCIHAARSKLKFFLSLLISTTLPNRDVGEIGKYTSNYSADVANVTVHQVSLELLHDPVFYEQRFVHRCMASRFCRILEKSIMPLSRDSANVDAKLDLLPDWKETLSALEKSSMAVGSKQLTCECSSRAEPVSFLYNGLAKKCSKEQTSFSLRSLRISASQSLLNLLRYLPKRSLSFKSFSRYATSLLKFERILVCSFVKSCWTLCLQKQHEVLRLLVSCRRALKYLIMEFCEDKMEASEYSILPVFAESPFPILWLLKSVSVVVGRQNILSNDDAGQVNDFVFSLMDHTSYIFLTLCKYQINYDRDCDLSGPTEFCCSMNSDISACFSVMTVAEILIDQTRNLRHSLNDVFSVGKAEVDGGTVDLNKFSSLMSCIQGFLWGLTSSLHSADIKICNLTTKPVRFKHEVISKISHCMDLFSEFIDALLQMFLIDNSQHPGCRCDSQEQLKPDHYDSSHVMGSSLKEGSIDENDPDYEKQHLNSEIGNMPFLSSDIVDDSDPCTYMKKLQSDVVCLATSVLTEDDSFTHNLYSKNLLRSILSGENLKAAFLLRELFIAASAMLRLSVQINYSPLSSSLLQILFGSSQFLLAELANVGEVPKPVAFIWLDGALRFLEELGSQFPLTSPITTRNVYARLVNLHLRAIGKCIILQGKRATLASHGTELSTKTLNTRIEVLESSSSVGLYGLEELMTRLRQSFKVLIQKSSELHLLSALQAIKRAIVGQVEGCTMIYEVNTGTTDGIASSTVAAGVDCLDLILEAATGNKRLGVVRRHIQTLIASLFNIILHLQGPAIFYEKLTVKGVNIDPDPGSVILMCVEVLTRISGKHVLFQMDSGHVGQSLRIPAALFQGFSQLKLWKDSHPSSCSRFTGNKNYDNLASSLSVDRNFSVNLYAACCRLLCTVLKNYKSECVQLIALLQNSVQALLYCLEMIDGDSAGRKGYFTWEVQEGIKCACYLRRIYEEIRQQRDIYGQHCFLFLSNYIWLYSGYGPSRKGIKREIDDALRPGIYALIDVCTSDDLQYLHTVFGEGPCRSTLSSLQQAYKLNFQYGGKV
ncbi:hypothetical protein Nepgr_018221 [Nepenthes gracilis]|uniref:Nucleolar 27S pre-rRNA processing Urb2/Npa2 C-terminal domain-containing protein n=1 Tax=Nepenthes gracilis TaxID=150966 RepID=A0AAD3XU32_NEPGR|nr:hypothetical protein Nepgr_018221 [Nepenthes gracilis]